MSLSQVRTLGLILGALCLSAIDGGQAQAQEPDPKLVQVVAGAHRAPQNAARDAWRHPLETLTFFGIRDDMTVVELWPFGGWYAEILGPYLRDRGRYFAAAMDPRSTNQGDLRYNQQLKDTMARAPQLYDRVQQTVLASGKYDFAPEGTADMVLTFRNIHNWQRQGIARDVFAAAFRALKPGGVLGVVEHRSDPHPTGTPAGYVSEADAIALIESVGFKLEAKSEINANPNDTKDHPRGVWTLPPNFAMGDQDRAKYEAIGESDRFTLKFVKPR